MIRLALVGALSLVALPLAAQQRADGWPLIPVPIAQLISSILIERATAGP